MTKSTLADTTLNNTFCGMVTEIKRKENKMSYIRKKEFSTLPNRHKLNSLLVNICMRSISPINTALITIESTFRLAANGWNYKCWNSIKLFTLASFKSSSFKWNALDEFLKTSIYQPILNLLFQQIGLINDIFINITTHIHHDTFLAAEFIF